MTPILGSPVSHLSRGAPEAQPKVTSHPSILSRLILLISFLHQPDTGMLFNLHDRPSGARRGANFKAGSETLSYTLPLLHAPQPESPANARQKKGDFFLIFQECEGLGFSVRDFLLTWTWSKDGSLRVTTRLARSSWTSWFQHRGGVWNGGGELPALTLVQYTQLMPRAGKSNNIICVRHYWWISCLICPSGGVEIL